MLTCVEVGEAAQLAAINTKARMFLVDSAQRGLEGVVCVAVDNAPFAGTFLSDPGLPGAAAFSRTDVAGDATFAATAAELQSGALSTATTSSASSLYLPGQPVLAASRPTSTTLVASSGGVLRLLGPDASGGCSPEAQVVRHATPGAWSCRQSVPNSAASCAAASAAARLGSLVVGAVPTITVASPTSAQWLAPSIANATLVDPATGTATPVAEADLPGLLSPASAAAGSAGASAGVFSGSGSANCSCGAVLVGFDLTLLHDGQGTLAAASASLRLANLSGLPCTPDAAGPAASASVPFSGSVAFELAGPAASAVSRSLAAGNVVSRARGGNPGYVQGAPVQAGLVVADPAAGSGKTAVQAAVEGLQLVGPGAGGECALAGGAAAAEPASTVPVAFGKDVLVGCSASLTAAQLQALCTSTGAATLSGSVVGLAGGLTHVGLFGNADPLQTTHWLAITATAATASPTWDADALTCRGMIVGYDLRLLSAPVGEARNAQRKIVAAASSFLTADLAAVDSTTPTPFAFTSTVSYAGLAAGALDRFIPPPPSVLALPHDLFYPFQINDIAIAAARAPSVGQAALWAATALALATAAAM